MEFNDLKGEIDMEKKYTERSKSVADKTYQYSDYYGDDQLSIGMSTTHEQVSDVYMEGTVDRAETTSNRDDYSDAEGIPRKRDDNK